MLGTVYSAAEHALIFFIGCVYCYFSLN